MIIREASLDEVWQLRHEVMWPDQELSFVQLKDDANGRHFGLYVNDTLVSVISLFPEGTRAQFRKFATLREEQGKGYGSRLLAYTLEEARRLAQMPYGAMPELEGVILSEIRVRAYLADLPKGRRELRHSGEILTLKCSPLC